MSQGPYENGEQAHGDQEPSETLVLAELSRKLSRTWCTMVVGLEEGLSMAVHLMRMWSAYHRLRIRGNDRFVSYFNSSEVDRWVIPLNCKSAKNHDE